MKLMIFSVLDNAVGAFLPPFMVRSRGEAIRSFSEVANDQKHQFHKNARDYVLHYLGEFDDTSGVFFTNEPERLLAAAELLEDGPPGALLSS